MAIDYHGLRSLTAREIISALTREGFISSANADLISVIATRTGGA